MFQNIVVVKLRKILCESEVVVDEPLAVSADTHCTILHGQGWLTTSKSLGLSQSTFAMLLDNDYNFH